MHFKIQVVVEDLRGKTVTEDIITLDKSIDEESLIGLSLAESKRVLKRLQKSMVRQQADHYTRTHHSCPSCRKKRRIKGCYDIQYRTLFGIVTMPNQRLYHCHCNQSSVKTFGVMNDWLSEHNSPELQYIETKWASLMSYGLTVDLLKEILPINESLDAETVRRHLHKTAKRLDKGIEGQPQFISGCQNDWSKLPKPDKPLTVGIDGGYVRDCDSKKSNFEVIVAKSFSKTQAPKRLGFVQTLDDKPQQRMMKLLKDQGMQENQQITFLSDGADTVRNLQFMMHPEAEHVLDWFHLTMRLTVLKQFARGMCRSDPEEGAKLQKHLDRTQWFLWHGNVEQCLDCLDDCYWLCDDESLHYSKRSKLVRHIDDMITYVRNNAHLIPNYGEKHRYGETITTAFVESTVNEVVAKRMVKKQQMQWSKHGAHYLLQTRTAVLNGELRNHFEQWYPGMDTKMQRAECEESVEMAA